MIQSKCSELMHELATMSDQFSELGDELLNAARRLHSPGSPPPDSLIAALTASRRSFFELRDRVCEHAQLLGVVIPPQESLKTLQEISALIDEATDIEMSHVRGEETRRRSLAILDRVAHLFHISDQEFAPLNECIDQARQLQLTISEADRLPFSDEIEALADGDHPFAHLLTLVENRDDLLDDHWASLHDSVGTTFGKALAAAAARAKLELSADAPSLPDNLPADLAGSRRNLGSASSSSM